ncbi:amino acid adenylation domain-containing protein [Actinoplanes sp. NPDC051851]|uniref:non-ribosomal peptide synthetase/type I polyketide synthase n=1 Tax=Actinoplanes sp. NPDC051851 TaxID=3154753 RepID=UPI00343C124F
MTDADTEGIAIVGMALRVPGADTPAAFWGNLRDGVESISTLTDEQLLADGADPGEIADPGYVRAVGLLDDVAGFDHRFFGFSAREAQLLDPQHRIMLECAWEALEHAGHPADRGDTVTGVYAGVGESSYLMHNLLPNRELVQRVGAFQTALGNDKDFVPTRVSYKLDLHGPSVSVQTGCSTSLVAVHMAAQALLAGECDIALAGGATVIAARRGYRHEAGGILSADGHCRAFDSEATGAVPSSGAGVVVLRRLADAIADGDVIHAVIRGSAINNDGSRKVGFTAPSVDGQADVIAEALGVSGVAPETISYVEAHGTGTPLGDPIEVAALRAVFGTAGAGRIALGSVKSNVGHLDTAAGVVGLIKTVLAMTARQLPPSLHVRTPNPRLELDGSPLRVNTALTDWTGDVLRAGVSSFGIGGTNAHVVLESAPPSPATAGPDRPQLLPLSAATPAALEATAARLAAHLRSGGSPALADVAFTLQQGRWRLPYRRFVVAIDLAGAVDALGTATPEHRPAQDDAGDRRVVFGFPGQGTQRVGMGHALYRGEPVFRAALDEIAGALAPEFGEDLRDLLYPADGQSDAARERITLTRYAQPALFAVQYALATLWQSWGVRPSAMLGHSVGELVAACVAGVLSPADASRLVAARGRLMQAAEPGAMVAVPLAEDEVLPMLGEHLAVAAVNGPRQCVVSGPHAAVEALEAALADRAVTFTRLRTSHAFHSPSMDAAAAAFTAEAARLPLAAPRIPFVSNVTGTWITDAQATDPAYWGRQLRAPVRFADGLAACADPDALWLEAGVGGALTGLAASSGAFRATVAGLDPESDAHREALTAAGRLWCHGAAVDFPAMHGAHRPRRVPLPTYPFQRERHWVRPPATRPAEATSLLSAHTFRRTAPLPLPLASPAAWQVVGEPAELLAGVNVTGGRPGAGVLHTALLDPEAPLSIPADPPEGRTVLLTTGVLDVTGEEDLIPQRSVLLDWARSGRPGSRTLIDVPAGAPPVTRRQVAAELTAARPEPVVAMRGTHRFVPSLEPLPVTGGGLAGRQVRVVGDEPAATRFARALARAGAGVTGAGTPEHVLVVLTGVPRGDTAEMLTAAIGAAHVVEAHVVGDPAAADAVRARFARSADATGASFTTYAWPGLDLDRLEALVPRIAGTAPGSCLVTVDPGVDPGTPPSGETDAAEPDDGDPVQQRIAAVFADLLGVPAIAPDTDFFALGGHSLLAAQVTVRVRQDCGVEVPLRVFVEDPTVRGLAAAVRAADATAGEPEPLIVAVPDPAAAGEPFPLTDVQQAYWIGRSGVFELGAGMHGYEEFDVEDLDVARLQAALRRTIARHGMLRAIVLPHGEQQILADVPDYVIVTEDVRGRGADAETAALRATRAAMSHQIFAPERWPLFEMRATLMDGGRGRVHFSIDGLITDAWASVIWMRELTRLYHEPDAGLPELELSFRDYVLATRQIERTARYDRAARYWLDRVPDLPPAPDLPLAADPQTMTEVRFSRLTGRLGAAPWARLRAQAARRGITPTAVLLTAYGEVLGSWSKSRRFTLNLPMANRLPLHPQVDAIVGDFTSVTLLEMDASGTGTFRARAEAVRARLAADLDHRLFGGVRVLREVKRRRGDAAAAMPVVFTSLFQAIGEHPQIGEVTYSISQTPQIWIDTQVYELDGELVLDIDAVDGLFPDGMVADIRTATLGLLDWLARDEDRWDEPMPSLLPAGQVEARQAYNRTAGPVPDGLLHEPFFAVAARDPRRTAVVTAGRTLSYGELAGRAYTIAGRLRPLRVRPSELIAVIMEKGWEQCAAVLGVLAAGGAYLPIDPDLPPERVRLLLEHSRARAVLTQSRIGAARFAGIGAVEAAYEVDTLPADGVPSGDTGEVTPGDLAYVIFTSGSTGLPKGVMIDHRGALNTVADVNDRFAIGADDRVLAVSSLSFDLSVYDIFGPLAVGGAIVVPEADAQRDPAAWLALLTGAGVTVWNSVPALMELLVEHLTVSGAAARLRLVMLSGDWIPVTLPERIRRALGGPEVISLGGATEASIWSILYPVGAVPMTWTSIPYGHPMRNQSFHVLDDDLRPCPDWVPGQLYIGGVGLAQGYLLDEAKTAAAFIVHPGTGERLYRTGDLGRFLPGGEIEFLGREDFQVKVQGYRIELGEIEAALTQHPGVRAAVAVAHGDPRGAKRLVAFVVAQAGEPLPGDLLDFLATTLPGYMIPGVLYELDELPLTANGKVDRRALVVPDEVDEADLVPYEAPGTAVEQAVAEVWASMLGVARVGVHDDFFALGGDSLMAMRVVVHLRQQLELDVPIRVLFDSPTLAETALVIEELLLTELESLSDDEAQSLLAN